MWIIFNSVYRAFLCCSFLALHGCLTQNTEGTLTVHATREGEYEIFKFVAGDSISLKSEQRVFFNQIIYLNPGSYLVLADCSSEVVQVYPKGEVHLNAHTVQFLPATPVLEGDRFPIRCARGDYSEFKQLLDQDFVLTILTGKHDLLVGMNPMHFDFTEPKYSRTPTQQTLILSSIQVQSESAESQSYFVSNLNDNVPHTEHLNFKDKYYLVPGDYRIEMNGTSAILSLEAGESYKIKPAQLRVSSPTDTDISIAEKIGGSPIHFEINGEHFLNLNQNYYILPGQHLIKLSQGKISEEIDAGEEALIELKTRSVVVKSNCSAGDWVCLGNRKVKIFADKKISPIYEGMTDVPILFFGQPSSVGIEGSRDIRYHLSNASSQDFYLSYLHVAAHPKHTAGIITDLLRVESGSTGQATGATLDLAVDRETIIPLIANQYQLSHYISQNTLDGYRGKTSIPFHLKPGETKEISIITHVSEKRAKALSQSKKNP